MCHVNEIMVLFGLIIFFEVLDKSYMILINYLLLLFVLELVEIVVRMGFIKF